MIIVEIHVYIMIAVKRSIDKMPVAKISVGEMFAYKMSLMQNDENGDVSRQTDWCRYVY
jgi:hypothetical protein